MRRPFLALGALLLATPALAQGFDPAALGLQGGAVSGRLIQLFAALSVLAVAPGLVIMVTSFTRFAIALSFLRSGLGLQSAPANLVLVSLALFMTLATMAPVFDRAWEGGLKPLLEGSIGETEAFARATAPFRDFMGAQVRPKDLALFAELARDAGGAAAVPAVPPGVSPAPGSASAEPGLRVLVPAFMISELRRGFEIGFLIALPFLVIDLIVATLVMSMGMMMLPPSVIALPIKLLFFVLIDGWNLVTGSLMRSYG